MEKWSGKPATLILKLHDKAHTWVWPRKNLNNINTISCLLKTDVISSRLHQASNHPDARHRSLRLLPQGPPHSRQEPRDAVHEIEFGRICGELQRGFNYATMVMKSNFTNLFNCRFHLKYQLFWSIIRQCMFESDRKASTKDRSGHFWQSTVQKWSWTQ